MRQSTRVITLVECLSGKYSERKNITTDSLMLSSRKQKKRNGGAIWKKTVILIVAKKMNQDIFITNMRDTDVKHELLRDDVETVWALCFALNIEMVYIKQQQTIYHPTI